MEHIAGYSIFNDVTVRDYQFRVTQYTSGKNFAASGPFGPYLVLSDEVPDPHRLDIATPAGVGFSRVPPEFLRAGDEVSVTISALARSPTPSSTRTNLHG